VKGTQRRLECPKCGKPFFAWRPEVLPGAKVKCYLCGNQFEDEAAMRKAPEPPAAATPPAAVPPAAAPPAAAPPAPEPKAN
jgi:uncharacterized Zn finger protein (UPF0148 family)